MQLTVNGESRSMPDDIDVARLLIALELSGKPVAVEVNRELVPRSEHAGRRLTAGDRVEVVTLVGGG